MLEAIRVRRSGFPFRFPYKEFCDRFKSCAPSAKGGKADAKAWYASIVNPQ